MDQCATKATRQQVYVQHSTTNARRLISYACNIFPSILIYILFAITIIFVYLSHRIYREKWSSDGKKYYVQNVSCLENCTLFENPFDIFPLISEIFLESVAWHIGLSVASLKWTVINLLTIFFFIYPLLDNKIEEKEADVCPNLNHSSNAMHCSSCQYIIRHAVVDQSLFFALTTVFEVGFVIVNLWYVLQWYQRRTLRNRLKKIPKRRPNNNQQSYLTKHSADRQLSMDITTDTTERSLLTLILEKVTVIEKKVREKENETNNSVSTNRARHNSTRHLVFATSFTLMKRACHNYLMVSAIILFYFLIHIIFVTNVLDDTDIYITDLFSPIKHNNKYMRKQFYQFIGLLAVMLSARAYKYAPKKKRYTRPKDMLHYLQKVFWFIEEIIQMTADLPQQEYELKDHRQMVDV